MIFNISKSELFLLYHKKHYTREFLSKKYKLTLYKVNEYIKHYNLKKGHIPRISRKELYNLLYKDKITPIDISKKFKLSISQVRWYMKNYKFKPRRRWKQLGLPENLTKKQIEYLIGNLLGDGYIHKTKGNGCARFEMEQTECKKDYSK